MKHRTAALALALAGLAALGATTAASAQERMPYRLTASVLGSIIPRDIVRSQMPFEARYADLTTAQKAELAQDYPNLAAGDEPPYPIDGMGAVARPMVRFGDTLNPVGELLVKVMVDAQGQPGDVSIYETPDPELPRLVAVILAHQQFKPAVCAGQPCAMPWVLRLDFPRRAGQDVQTTGMASRLMTPADLGFH